jgi:hypothetical protein
VCQRWNYQLVSSVRRPDRDDGDGRYTWESEFRRPKGKHHRCEVQMFGVSRDYAEGGNPLGFAESRVYLDGSSWVWDFVVSSAAAYFDRNPDDECHSEHAEHDASERR